MRIWAVTVVCVLFWAGCSSDSGSSGPSGNEKACQDLEAKLNQCGRTAAGTCASQDPCVVQCALKADCAAIAARPPTGPYLECIATCSGAGPGDFICKDGTAFVKPAGICDGRFQCQDGSDEANCGGKDAGGPG